MLRLLLTCFLFSVQTLLSIATAASTPTTGAGAERDPFAPAFTADAIDWAHTTEQPVASELGTGNERNKRLLTLFNLGDAIPHLTLWRPEGDGDKRWCRLAFTKPVTIGSIIGGGYDYHPRVRVAMLRDNAPFPGDVSNDDQWEDLPTTTRHGVGCVVLPANRQVRALRFIGPQPVLHFTRGRIQDLLPTASISASGGEPSTLQDDHITRWVHKADHILTTGESWLMLSWDKEQSMRGLFVLEPGMAELEAQIYIGAAGSDPGSAKDNAWRTLASATIKAPWRYVWKSWLDFGENITTSAVRVRALRPFTNENSDVAHGEGKEVSLGAIMVVQDIANQTVTRAQNVAEGVVPITFTMPGDGVATIQIIDEKGAVVEDLVNGRTFTAGKHTVMWDLSTLDEFWTPYAKPAQWGSAEVPPERAIAAPGKYSWRGIWHPPLSLHYDTTFSPLKQQGVGWISADRTGGWLADHVPPQDVVRGDDNIWCGTFCEGGHGLLEADTSMKKIWGSGRIGLANPRVLAADGDSIFFAEQNGWIGNYIAVVQVRRSDKAARRLLMHAIEAGEHIDIEGLEVVGDRLYLSDSAGNQVIACDISINLRDTTWTGHQWGDTVADAESMRVLARIPLRAPSRMRRFDDTHLAVAGDGGVALIDRRNNTVSSMLVRGLVNPCGLAVTDSEVYVGEMAPAHTVKVFDRSGKALRTIGKGGGHKVGRFDPDTLESPAGLAVDGSGQLWVCEFNQELKRTSIWNRSGHCVNQVVGPPSYGGSGVGGVDPHDSNHFFNRGEEYRRDPKTGAISLVNLFWRKDDTTYPSFSGHHDCDSPSYPFYRDGVLYFTSFQGWGYGHATTLWRYDRDHVRPVAALGRITGAMRVLAGQAEQLGPTNMEAWHARKVMQRVEPVIDNHFDQDRPIEDPDNADFGVRWNGIITIPVDGEYNFSTYTKHSNRLLIDGKVVIENWSMWGRDTNNVDHGRVILSKGPHTLMSECRIVPGWGYPQIRLAWKGPGFDEQTVPASAFHRSDATDATDAPLGLDASYFIDHFDDALFAWTDLNDDGQFQQNELRTGPLTYAGKRWISAGATWQFRLNQDFVAALSDGGYSECGIIFFQVERLTAQGYPVYTLPSAFTISPYENDPTRRPMAHAADAVMVDRAGNAVTLDAYVASWKSDGSINWRYRNRWPGLHGGYGSPSSSAKDVGVLAASTRFYGSGLANDAVGEVLCIGTNYGSTHFITAAEGMYVDRAFLDSRVGLGWDFNQPPSDAQLERISLGQEHFGGVFQRIDADKGDKNARFVYTISAGSPHASVVELHGLERIARLAGGTLNVTAEQRIAADRLRQSRAAEALSAHRYFIRRSAAINVDGKVDEWKDVPRIDGFALTFDDKNLYVLCESHDDRAPFQNAATGSDFMQAFKTGDVVDVMLQTSADAKPDRGEAGGGDIRLSIAQVDGKPTAILYDYVVPGTAKDQRLPFSSPWETVFVDRVSRIADAQITVIRGKDTFVLEAAIPLASLHLNPAKTPVIRGDVGRVISDQSGARVSDRVYWSNPNTKNVSDLPSETRVQPNLWGTFHFQK